MCALGSCCITFISAGNNSYDPPMNYVVHSMALTATKHHHMACDSRAVIRGSAACIRFARIAPFHNPISYFPRRPPSTISRTFHNQLSSILNQKQLSIRSAYLPQFILQQLSFCPSNKVRQFDWQSTIRFLKQVAWTHICAVSVSVLKSGEIR